MFDNLFSKSLKTKIDLSDRRKRGFSERHQVKFKPHENKDVKFYNGQTIKSMYDKELKFTNYYSNKTKSEVLQRVEELSEDLSIVRNFSPNTIDFNKKRIERIIKLYINDFDSSDLEEDKVMKVTLGDSLGQQDGVRLYFLLNTKLDAYEILLIDLFHLVIPSDLKDRKGKIIKQDKVLNSTFSDNQNNQICISDYFNYTS